MWYWIFRCISLVILKLLFRLKAEGAENIPDKSNFIVVANHVSFLDPFIVGSVIPKKIYWITRREFHSKFGIRWFMRKLGTLASGSSSSQQALELLRNNSNVGLFPEGRRTHDGKLQNFKRGMTLLALATGRPILPCAIIGAYEAFPRHTKFPRFRPVKVKIGKPVYLLKEHEEIIDGVYMQDGMDKVWNIIKEMLDAK